MLMTRLFLATVVELEQIVLGSILLLFLPSMNMSPLSSITMLLKKPYCLAQLIECRH